MTDMLQKSENVAKNVANKKSQDLTEKWRKGELPDGWYWVKKKTCEEYIDKVYFWYDTFIDGDVPLDNDKVIEVLAKVPSYEEYERILVENDNLKQTRDALDCAVTQLREDITDYKETIDEQERELSDSAFREDNLEKENVHLAEQLIQSKQAMSQALSYLACMDRISDTEPNEQLAFDVLRKCLEELEK